MQVKQFNTGHYDANSYLINGKVLIDTGINTSALMAAIGEHINIDELELIVLTHCHFDHTAAVPEIAKRSGARIAIHKDELPLLKDKNSNAAALFGRPVPVIEPDILLEDEQRIDIGNGEELQVIHTPGHTPGCVCLYEPITKGLFSGDTVFPEGSIGRTDFPGGDGATMISSIRKLTALDIRAMYPGHGNITTTRVNEQIKMSLNMSERYHRS